MKKNEVKVDGMYTAKVSDKLVAVRIDSTHSSGGWNATNTRTGKRIRIKSAQRLRRAANETTKAKTTEGAKQANSPKAAVANDANTGSTVVRDEKTEAAVANGEKAKTTDKAAPKKTKSTKSGGEKKPKRVSALDAAAQVLAKAGKPMRAAELIAAMEERGLWKSPAGATPWATLYAAMMREARDKGDASRFRKVDRGLFAFNNEAK